MDRKPEPELMDVPERAQAYADADFAEVNAAFVERLLDVAGDHGEALALDLGTGPGEIPLLVLEQRPGWRIVAVDASWAMLQLGQDAKQVQPGANAVRFLAADAKRTPFPEYVFDVVFSNSLLHHLPDPVPFWYEVKRVARPGAAVLVRDLIRPESAADAERLVETYAGGEHELLKEDFYNSFLAAFNEVEVFDQLEHAGLESKLRIERLGDRHMDVFGHL